MAAVSEEETRWSFAPAVPWTSQRYSLCLHRALEDRAGNRFDRLFDREAGAPTAPATAPVCVPFRPRIQGRTLAPGGVVLPFTARLPGSLGHVERPISSLIASADEGDHAAADTLFVTLYSELHRLARRQLARSSSELTLGTTTLLHEAYLDMSSRESSAYVDRGRFMAYAARVMRGLIIDHARNRKAVKRGGRFEIASLASDVAQPADAAELTRIGEALEELGATDPQLAQVVDLKFFCGFSFAEIAAMRGVSERTVQRQWDKARIYLYGLLGQPERR
jgi:RNA polymerase sigma factor (TIGR02999 family)